MFGGRVTLATAYSEALNLLSEPTIKPLRFEAPVTVVKQIVDNGKAISTVPGMLRRVPLGCNVP